MAMSTRPESISAGTDKCTPERCQAIVDAVRKGNYRGTAARLSGINESTLRDWLGPAIKAREAGVTLEDYHRPAHYQLLIDIEEAEAEVEADLVESVRRTGLSGLPNTWQAAMTMLERKMPEKWGKRDAVTIRGDEDHPILVETRVLIESDETRNLQRGLLRNIATARAGISSGSGVGDGPTFDAEEVGASAVEIPD